VGIAPFISETRQCASGPDGEVESRFDAEGKHVEHHGELKRLGGPPGNPSAKRAIEGVSNSTSAEMFEKGGKWPGRTGARWAAGQEGSVTLAFGRGPIGRSVPRSKAGRRAPKRARRADSQRWQV